MQWQLIPLVLIIVIRSAKVAATQESECIPPHFFKCRNSSKCISQFFVCDSENDCEDGSDEDPEQCFNNELPLFREAVIMEMCNQHEFQCVDQSDCIPKDDYCDGKEDCIDGSDEVDNCYVHKTCNGFKCTSGQCVLTSCVCDGTKDCRDGSDELNCSAELNCNSTIDKYLCANRRCIDLALTCNNIDNCGDNSDENPAECEKAEKSCELSPCSSKCRPTPKGYQCAYSAGHILKNDISLDLLFCFFVSYKILLSL